MSAHLSLEVGVFVEHREDRLAAGGWKREDEPVEAEVEKLLDLILVRADPEHRDREFVATSFLTSLGERLQVGGEIVAGKIYRHPSVAVFGDAIERLWRLGAEQNRRSAYLNWLGEIPHRIEVHELAVELSGFLGPDLAHREDFFLDEFPAPLEGCAVIFHLLDVPSGADSEDHASSRDHVERCDFLAERYRIALAHQAYAGA